MVDRTYGGKCPIHGRFGCTCGKPKAAPLHAITTVAERHERDGLSAATSTLRAWLNGNDVEGPALVAELRYWLDYWGGSGTSSARTACLHCGRTVSVATPQGTLVDGHGNPICPDGPTGWHETNSARRADG